MSIQHDSRCWTSIMATMPVHHRRSPSGARGPASRRGAAGARSAALIGLAVAVACCSDAGTDEPDVTLPVAGASFDYQIGGSYPPHPATRVVSRDRGSEPADGLYSICYVNAFQAQPGDLSWWEEDHPDLLLRDSDGEHVVDQEWDEVLLDISTPDRRAAAADVVGAWIDRCAADGFDAVEPDNLDSYARSDGLLTRDDAAAFATLLAERAHSAGLAIAQKNDTELAPQGRDIGFDFAVVEECNRWSECDPFATAYDSRVFVVEYRDRDLDTGCADWPELAIVRRDREVSAQGSDTYRYATC